MSETRDGVTTIRPTGTAAVWDEQYRAWRVYAIADGAITREYDASSIAQRQKRSFADAMYMLGRISTGQWGRGNRSRAPRGPRGWFPTTRRAVSR